jgi:hypothetical protein
MSWHISLLHTNIKCFSPGISFFSKLNTLCAHLRSTRCQSSLYGMIRICSKGPEFQMNDNQLSKCIAIFKSQKNRTVQFYCLLHTQHKIVLMSWALVRTSSACRKYEWWDVKFSRHLKNNIVIKGIVSKLTIKFWVSQKMWQNERLQHKNDYKCCRMITNTLDMIISKSSLFFLRLVDWHVLNSVHNTK